MSSIQIRAQSKPRQRAETRVSSARLDWSKRENESFFYSAIQRHGVIMAYNCRQGWGGGGGYAFPITLLVLHHTYATLRGQILLYSYSEESLRKKAKQQECVQ